MSMRIIMAVCVVMSFCVKPVLAEIIDPSNGIWISGVYFYVGMPEKTARADSIGRFKELPANNKRDLFYLLSPDGSDTYLGQVNFKDGKIDYIGKNVNSNSNQNVYNFFNSLHETLVKENCSSIEAGRVDNGNYSVKEINFSCNDKIVTMVYSEETNKFKSPVQIILRTK